MTWIFFKLDNGNDHRAGTENLNIEKDAQARLRVHRIVIPRLRHALRHDSVTVYRISVIFPSRLALIITHEDSEWVNGIQEI